MTARTWSLLAAFCYIVLFVLALAEWGLRGPVELFMPGVLLTAMLVSFICLLRAKHNPVLTAGGWAMLGGTAFGNLAVRIQHGAGYWDLFLTAFMGGGFWFHWHATNVALAQAMQFDLLARALSPSDDEERSDDADDEPRPELPLFDIDAEGAGLSSDLYADLEDDDAVAEMGEETIPESRRRRSVVRTLPDVLAHVPGWRGEVLDEALAEQAAIWVTGVEQNMIRGLPVGQAELRRELGPLESVYPSGVLEALIGYLYAHGTSVSEARRFVRGVRQGADFNGVRVPRLSRLPSKRVPPEPPGLDPTVPERKLQRRKRKP